MVQLDKRRFIWSLYLSSNEIVSFLNERKRGAPTIEMSEFLDLLGSLGYDSRSDSLIEILRLALIDGNHCVDTSLLFHVIGEAVRKVRHRNVMFWNTVITVSSSTIAWVDFRRKLSRWLSSNELNVSQVKSILLYAQEKLDRTNAGVVRKDDFMAFCEEIMGVDCLLSPDITLLSTMAPVRRIRLIPKVIASDPPSAITRSNAVPKATSIPVVDLNPIPRPPVKTSVVDIEIPKGREPGLVELHHIRVRLGSQAVLKLFHSRMRLPFLVYRLRHESATRKNINIERSTRHREGARLMSSIIRSMITREVLRVLVTLKNLAAPCSLVEDDLAPIMDGEMPPGPSWTVTIQAVAVVNLIGVCRAALMRLKLVGYFTIRTGHCLDENYSLRMVSWSQSKQGKKDAKDAHDRILQPIPENTENLDSQFEFDLSS
jgi:hypothetical protein